MIRIISPHPQNSFSHLFRTDRSNRRKRLFSSKTVQPSICRLICRSEGGCFSVAFLSVALVVWATASACLSQVSCSCCKEMIFALAKRAGGKMVPPCLALASDMLSKHWGYQSVKTLLKLFFNSMGNTANLCVDDSDDCLDGIVRPCDS